jgi:hypothetical protein
MYVVIGFRLLSGKLPRLLRRIVRKFLKVDPSHPFSHPFGKTGGVFCCCLLYNEIVKECKAVKAYVQIEGGCIMAKEFKLKEVLDKVEDAVKELKNDDELQAKFKKEPIKTLEEITGLDLPDEKVKKVVDLIEAKIDDADVDEKMAALGDKLEDFGDDLKEKVGGFFKKFDRD